MCIVLRNVCMSVCVYVFVCVSVCSGDWRVGCVLCYVMFVCRYVSMYLYVCLCVQVTGGLDVYCVT